MGTRRLFFSASSASFAASASVSHFCPVGMWGWFFLAGEEALLAALRFEVRGKTQLYEPER